MTRAGRPKRERNEKRRLLLLVGACGLWMASPLASGGQPLLDLPAFLQEVRAHLELDGVRQSRYVFIETRRDTKLDKDRRMLSEGVSVFESYPGLPGQPRWKRQVVRNGAPLSAVELEKQDRKRREHVIKYAAALERESRGDRAAAERQRERQRRENDAIVDDALRTQEVTMLGREVLAGHVVIVLSFTPKPDVEARTREGRLLRRFAGKAWVSEAEYEIAKLEVEAIDTVSVGLGVVARIHPGSRLVFERRKVNGEEWLPSSASYAVSARLLVFKNVRASAVSEFSGYRRFSVATEMAVTSPREKP